MSHRSFVRPFPFFLLRSLAFFCEIHFPGAQGGGNKPLELPGTAANDAFARRGQAVLSVGRTYLRVCAFVSLRFHSF